MIRKNYGVEVLRIVQKKVYAVILITLGSSYAYALPRLFSSNSESDSNNGILGRHNHSQHISSETKTAAKVAACATVAKGVCLGVTGVKYATKELGESGDKASYESSR